MSNRTRSFANHRMRFTTSALPVRKHGAVVPLNHTLGPPDGAGTVNHLPEQPRARSVVHLFPVIKHEFSHDQQRTASHPGRTRDQTCPRCCVSADRVPHFQTPRTYSALGHGHQWPSRKVWLGLFILVEWPETGNHTNAHTPSLDIVILWVHCCRRCPPGSQVVLMLSTRQARKRGQQPQSNPRLRCLFGSHGA